MLKRKKCSQKNAGYIIFCFSIPWCIGLKNLDIINYLILTLSTMITLILSYLPYMISNKCFLDVMISKHPIRQTKIAYKNYPIVFPILFMILSINIFNYLMAFKIIKII